MESIQQQISTLTRKVDRVYQIIDRLNQHVFENLDSQVVNGEEISIEHPHDPVDPLQVSDDARRLAPEITRYGKNGSTDRTPSSNFRDNPAEWLIAQQDVLIDSNGMEISHYQIKEQDLSPQVQIQRLTAQLTAAYNRIAALEEQLLAKRWK